MKKLQWISNQHGVDVDVLVKAALWKFLDSGKVEQRKTIIGFIRFQGNLDQKQNSIETPKDSEEV